MAPYRFKRVLIGVVLVMGRAPAHCAEPSNSDLAAAYERQTFASTPFAEVISGRWDVVPEMQPLFDEMSARPQAHGKIADMTFLIFNKDTEEKFWRDDESKKLGEAVRKIAARRNHKILATGSCGESGGQPFYAHFILTQCEGEAFISVLYYEQESFEPWRIHYIAGKERTMDLLVFEMGSRASGTQVLAMRRSSKEPEQ